MISDHVETKVTIWVTQHDDPDPKTSLQVMSNFHILVIMGIFNF